MSEDGIVTRVIQWFGEAEHWSGPSGVPARLAEHLQISGTAILIAAAIALPAAMYIGHRRRFELLVVSIANIGRAIPSFGLLFLFYLFLGIGDEPAIVAMVLLAIPPILTNAYVGIQGVDPDTIEAARGMGFSELRVLTGIELRLAAPVIVAGLRTAAVQVVATATLAAVVAGGGLGRFIVLGFAAGRDEELIAGALLVALLAIATELAFGLVQRAVTPRTTRQRKRMTAAPAPLAGPAA